MSLILSFYHFLYGHQTSSTGRKCTSIVCLSVYLSSIKYTVRATRNVPSANYEACGESWRNNWRGRNGYCREMWPGGKIEIQVDEIERKISALKSRPCRSVNNPTSTSPWSPWFWTVEEYLENRCWNICVVGSGAMWMPYNRGTMIRKGQCYLP